MISYLMLPIIECGTKVKKKMQSVVNNWRSYLAYLIAEGGSNVEKKYFHLTEVITWRHQPKKMVQKGKKEIYI